MPPKKSSAAKGGTKPAAKGSASKGAAKGSKKSAKPGSAVGSKKGAAAPSPNADKKESTPAESKWTPQDEAAVKIQTQVRQFLAKAALRKLKKEKEEYDELMDRLEKEAFVKVVKMQQEQAELELRIEEEERRKKREEIKRRKRLLEAAFDGDIEEIKAVLKEVEALYQDKTDAIGRALCSKHLHSMVECEDANKNTALSEAAAGGVAHSVRMLLNKGADPNSKGHFGRTPVYRAAFAGHLEAVQMLLQYGADPRLIADDAQTPQQVASQKAVVELLESWDIERTERLLSKLVVAKEKRLEEDKKRRAAEASKLEDLVAEAQRNYGIWQKQLCKAVEELNSRITEHDTGVSTGFDKPEVTEQMIHDAEANVEITRMDFEKARDILSSLKLQLRDKQLEGTSKEGQEDDLPGLKVMVRELDEVLMRDVGNRIRDSGKWPLIIDPTGQAATFIRYRDTNYITALNPTQMEPEKIRLALLGSVRYGKPLVVDMMEVDMFESCTTRFDDVQANLMQSIMDKSIRTEEVYCSLIRESDGPSYHKLQFSEQFTERFQFWLITKNPFPPEHLLDDMYPIRVYIPS